MKVLITGITGQDGSYLTELLLSKGYEVHGIIRRSSCINTHRIDHLYQDPHIKDCKLFLHYGDLLDSANLIRLVDEIHPDEVYNLGAQSHVRVSFDSPEYTANVDALGTLRLLEAIRMVDKNIRFYQASTSELYGLVQQTPQTELTPFYPRSPYGVAKLYAYWICKNYREAYNMYICNGILFNHESPRRGETFVTRKITLAAARIAFGLQDKLYLGNLNARRDWGHARDFVEGMYLMLQQPNPDDYVLATGETHSVKEFIEECNKYCDFDLMSHVEIDPRYYRPSEVQILQGSYAKAKKFLLWKPKVKFHELVFEMLNSDMEKVQKEKLQLECGSIEKDILNRGENDE